MALELSVVAVWWFAGLMFGGRECWLIAGLVFVLIRVVLLVDLVGCLFSGCWGVVSCLRVSLVCCGWLTLVFIVLIVLVSCYEYILCCVF